jgi:hypothetical protein
MHSSGLRCSHNSELDTKIPRAKLPKRALPDCLRKKLKGVKIEENNNDDVDVYKAGSGVLAPVGSAPDGTFLKRGSGVPMSIRASALAQQRGDAANARATIYRAARVDGKIKRNDDRDSIRWANNKNANKKDTGSNPNMKNNNGNKSSPSFTSLPPINKNCVNNSSQQQQQQQNKKSSSMKYQSNSSLLPKSVNKRNNNNQPQQQQKVRRNSLSNQMDTFLQTGETPRLMSKSDELILNKKMSKPKYQVKYDLVDDALYIMDKVNSEYGKILGQSKEKTRYGPGDIGYLEQFFGPSISQKAAKAWLDSYLNDNELVGKIEIQWSNDQDSNSGNGGVGNMYNEDEDKLYIMVNDNFPGIAKAFGIQMFAHHEIGTRGMRIMNDKHQPWYSDRKSYHLTSQGSREAGATEEGFASIHSMIGCNDPKHRYLWNIAVLYYACAMGVNMTFGELFDHLSTWVSDRVRRFNICCRVKRGVCGNNPSTGASGQCQCYFEGAHDILTRVVNDPLLDLRELYFGKICLKDLDQAAAIADKDYLLLPLFTGGMQGTNESYNNYVEELKEIALLNGICH